MTTEVVRSKSHSQRPCEKVYADKQRAECIAVLSTRASKSREKQFKENVDVSSNNGQFV